MPTYSVTIQGIVSVTYDVEADDKETATEKANNLFNNDPDNFSVYGQETVDVRIVEPEPERLPPLPTVADAIVTLRYWTEPDWNETDRKFYTGAVEALEHLLKRVQTR